MESTGRPLAPEGFWSVPRLWEGQTVFIIGGGPSLTDFDWTKLHSHRCIGCNDAYLLGPKVVDLAFFGDVGWYNIHNREWIDQVGKPGLPKFPGIVCSCTPRAFLGSWVKRLQWRPKGLYREPYRCGWNGNTGAAALNCALHTGASKIVLLGFDMKLGPRGQSNFHVNLKDKPSETVYRRFMSGFENAKKDLRVMWPDVQVVNATKGSKMQTFPIVALEDVLGG